MLGLSLAVALPQAGWTQEEEAKGEEPAAAVAAAAESKPEEKAAAETPMSAKALRVDGLVEVKGPSDTMFHPVASGADLPMSGTIRATSGAKAQIQLPNGVIILVREFTVVRLDQLAKDKNSEISIPIGEFLIGLKSPLPAGQVFRVKTPSSVAGIRGTLFWGLADADMTTTFACFHDTIVLEASGKTVELVPGKLSSVKLGEAPAEPADHSVPASYLENFAVEGSLEGLPDLLK